MKLWTQWGLLVLAWFFSYSAIGIWPIMNNNLQMESKSDVISAMMYKPFHYVTAFLFLIFFIYIASYVFKKCIYECKVAYLFRKIPYETLVLLGFISLLYIRIAFRFPIILITLTAISLLYDLISYLQVRKEKVIYVRE
jgi:hypothetical protein